MAPQLNSINSLLAQLLLELTNSHMQLAVFLLQPANNLTLVFLLLLLVNVVLLQSAYLLLLLRQLHAQAPHHCWLTAAGAGTVLQQLQPHVRG